MEKREKIKKIYQKYDVNINEDYMQEIMNNPQRVDNLMRMYKEEEINAMNEIFDKDENNKVFTREELEFVKDIDLFDRASIKVTKEMWKTKDDTQVLKSYIKILENEGKQKGKELLNIFTKKEVVTNVSNH